MEYPPPPYNVFLAYSFGKISETEAAYLWKLWEEKYQLRGEQDGADRKTLV